MLYLGAKRSLLSSGKTLAQQLDAMFAGGEQGAWYEPSLTNGTLFQDSAGTTPVTAVGQPVGLMLDKSGRGNASRQVTAINRPVLQIDGNGKYYLAFNGTNSWMSTAAIDFTGTDKVTVAAGVRKLTGASAGMVFEFGTTFSTPGSIYLATTNAGSNYELSAFGGAQVKRVVVTSAAPASLVVFASADFAQAVPANALTTRLNGAAQAGVFTGTATSGNLGSNALYLGARAGTSAFLNGGLYGLIVRGVLSTAPQIASAEKLMAQKTGVTLA